MVAVRRIALIVVDTALLLTAWALPAVAQHAPATVARIAGAANPLPGCAVTFAPDVGSDEGRSCLTPASGTGVQAQSCAFTYYENGPYGSPDWRNGWSVCVAGWGNYYVPLALNDKASSWDSCATGTFYANQPNTDPRAGFPPDSAGNFPRGGVANDALSSAYVNYPC